MEEASDLVSSPPDDEIAVLVGILIITRRLCVAHRIIGILQWEYPYKVLHLCYGTTVDGCVWKKSLLIVCIIISSPPHPVVSFSFFWILIIVFLRQRHANRMLTVSIHGITIVMIVS